MCVYSKKFSPQKCECMFKINVTTYMCVCNAYICRAAAYIDIQSTPSNRITFLHFYPINYDSCASMKFCGYSKKILFFFFFSILVLFSIHIKFMCYIN